jgi:hypothetical protein
MSDNPFTALVVSKSNRDLAAVSEDHSKVLRLYLLRLRKLFQEDQGIRTAVLIEDKEERKKQVLELTSKEISLGTEDVYEKAVDLLLEEYDKMKLAPYQQYIVDGRTGLTIAPLTEDSLFTPPDYIGEDGKKHKSQTIVHPGISSALGLALQERSKIVTAITKGGPAFEHLKDPSSITDVAKSILESLGYEICKCSDEFMQIYEIGHEKEEGVFQSSNPSFHRYKMFGSILAKKVSDFMKLNNFQKCEIGIPKLIRNGKQRYYSIEVKVAKVLVLSSNHVD